MKVWEALFDILSHEVGEMAGRPKGAHSSHRSRIRAPIYELARAPLLVADSSRPPAVASGGRETGPLSLHKPWIEAEREESGRGPFKFASHVLLSRAVTGIMGLPSTATQKSPDSS